MPEIIDACVEFDGRLIEGAFSNSSDAELELHVASCAACRAAREGYRTTARALETALAEPLPSVERAKAGTRATRSHLPRLAWILAAASVIAAVVLWRTLGMASIRWVAAPGAVVRALAPDRARIEAGSATFEVRRESFVLEVPVGELRTDDATFRVDVAGEKDVTVDVSMGAVHWVVGEQETAVRAGESISRERVSSAVERSEVAPVLTESGNPSSTRSSGVAGDAVVGFEIRGRVVDGESDTPITGAEIIFGARNPGGVPMAARSRTIDDGSFVARSAPMEDSVAERWPFNVRPTWRTTCFTVEADGFAPHAETPVMRFYRESPFDVGGPIDLGLIRLSKGATVSGRVVRADGGRPIGGARILLVEDAPTISPIRFIGQEAHEVARSGADGRFLLDRRVRARGPELQHWLLACTPEGLGWTLLEVAGAVHEVRDVEISIGVSTAIQVVVEDAEGHPIPDATVWAEPRFDPLLPSSPHARHDPSIGLVTDDGLRSLFERRTDSSGRIRFDSLPTREGKGRYDIVASHEGFVRDAKEDLNVEVGSVGEARVSLKADRPRVVSGTVRSEDGAAVAGAVVETANSRGVLRCTTDASGTYQIEGLMVSNAGAGFRVRKSGFTELQKHVSFPSTEDVVGIDFVLKQARPISGRIVDQHGVPVSAAECGIWQGSQWHGMHGGKTGPDGEFRFDDATEGEWELNVSPPDPRTDWMTGWAKTKVHGGDANLRVVLERDERSRSRLIVEIVDETTGESLDPLVIGAAPFPSRTGTSYMAPKVTLQHGQAILEPLHAGDWAVWVRTPNHAITRQVIHIDEGVAESRMLVRVGRPAAISGRVEFDESPPSRPVTLLFLLGDGGRLGGNDWSGGSVADAYFEIQPDGSFRVENLTPGPWVVTLRDQGWLAKETVEVVSGRETELVVHPTRGALLDFSSTAPSPGDTIQFWFAEGDEVEWRSAMRLGAMKGKDLLYTETVPAGRVRWKVEFLGENAVNASSAAATQEGELQVSPGEELEILVPVVPKK